MPSDRMKTAGSGMIRVIFVQQVAVWREHRVTEIVKMPCGSSIAGLIEGICDQSSITCKLRLSSRHNCGPKSSTQFSGKVASQA